ncbi:MAG: hypothetical protein JWR84_1246 [Caulobacter sp.]|nr:hypothetical protein [Caulobacter sp.]
MTRPPKKSESLEIRLPYETKTAFMDRCRLDGVTASEALRADIEARLTRRPAIGWKQLRAIAGAAVILGVGAGALPSLAAAVSGPSFASLDRDRDGALAFREFAAAPVRIEAGGLTFTADPALRRQLQRRAFDSCDANHDGVLSPAEFRRGSQV